MLRLRHHHIGPVALVISTQILLLAGLWYLHIPTSQEARAQGANASSTLHTTDTLETPDGLNLLGYATERPLPQPIEIPKHIAITFDDGPHRKYTQQILSVLRRYRVPATFFVLGERLESHADILQQIAADGHQIGNHSWNHHINAWTKPHVIREQIEKTSEEIFNLTGIVPTVFRPPYGYATSNVRQGSPLPVVLWSIDARDWQRGDTVHDVTQRVVSTAYDGGIILMHDTHERTVGAVERIIIELRAQGYEFVTLEEMLPPNL